MASLACRVMAVQAAQGSTSSLTSYLQLPLPASKQAAATLLPGVLTLGKAARPGAMLPAEPTSGQAGQSTSPAALTSPAARGAAAPGLTTSSLPAAQLRARGMRRRLGATVHLSSPQVQASREYQAWLQQLPGTQALVNSGTSLGHLAAARVTAKLNLALHSQLPSTTASQMDALFAAPAQAALLFLGTGSAEPSKYR
ncbi:zinc phosphodiesterase ELAC 2-like isoform X2 [Haematococcus lacustris]|uniref:Zinc phosphodiesterase ELAC 2-like isoform X2 n=1 Tax=Haematococcus lacustris TaxID=44745 RepID=A0A6A0A3S6_HAELA|nr:zinc phosphodiesterase ELAC 2-like isoform X2 [Haematococcus lacustris]